MTKCDFKYSLLNDSLTACFKCISHKSYKIWICNHGNGLRSFANRFETNDSDKYAYELQPTIRQLIHDINAMPCRAESNFQNWNGIPGEIKRFSSRIYRIGFQFIHQRFGEIITVSNMKLLTKCTSVTRRAHGFTHSAILKTLWF